MSVFNKTNSFGLLITAALLLGLLSGCGGGNSNNTAATNKTSGTSSNAGTGRVQLTIAWPPRTAAGTSRYIPPYAASLVLTLTNKTDPTQNQSLTVNRTDDKPSTQTVAFPKELLVGTYVLNGIARADKDGNGTTVASAATEVIVQSGQTANAPLTLASSISNLSVVGQPLQIIQGQTLNLSGKAVDRDGFVLFLPKSALIWSLVSGDTFGSVTPDGVFTAIKAGVARVRLSEPGANLSAEADITVVTKSIQAPGLANSAWPKFRGNIANTGQSIGTGAVGTQLWQFSLQNGNKRVQVSSPVIGADGTVYASSVNGTIYSLDGSTGAVKWQFAPGAPVFSTAAVGTDGTVYIGCQDKKVYALDGVTGAKKWEFLTGAYVDASPNIGADGTVYAASDKVYALDSTTGAQKWAFQPAAGGSFNSSPALGADGSVYIGGPDGNLYALNGTTGAVIWQFSLGGHTYSSPAVAADGTIYIANEGGTLYAVDGAKGTQKWSAGANGASSPGIGADGTVYMVSGSNLNALDPATGALQWKFAASGYIMYSSPAIGGDGTVYIGSGEGKVYTLDGATGIAKWSFQTSASIASVPALGANGTVYVTNQNGDIYAIK